MSWVEVSYIIFLYDKFVSACSDVDPDSAYYVCAQCGGSGTSHDAVQLWQAECYGWHIIALTMQLQYTLKNDVWCKQI